jgi:hypothetical protein
VTLLTSRPIDQDDELEVEMSSGGRVSPAEPAVAAHAPAASQGPDDLVSPSVAGTASVRTSRSRTARIEQVGEARPVLVVVEEYQISTAHDPYLSLAALARYSGCSVRWLRDRLTDPHHPLPRYRLPSGKILVRRSEFDVWIARYRRVGDPDVDRIVNEALEGLQ